MKIGDLVRYKHRYDGEQFVVVGVRKRMRTDAERVQCVSVQTLKKTRWSHSTTLEVINENR
jgi:hypothetical protein